MIDEVSGNLIEMPEFESFEDYMNTTTAFEWVYQFHDSKFTESKMLEKMSRYLN